MIKVSRKFLLGSTGLAALAAGALPAHAQDALETVIVTAEKQPQDIQKTGISVDAIDPNTVNAQGDTRLQDVLFNVPGVSVFRANGTNASFFIRGIGTMQGVSSTLEMMDGVNMAPDILENFATADVARIEVLRGPQGTLYGRGALGGLVNVVTNDPSDKYEGKIFVEGGSYNMVNTQAVVNIPLSDDMAMRIVAVSRQQTGYMHPDGRAGNDYQGMRAKLQYKPTEDFTFQLRGDFTNNFQAGAADTLPQKTRVANFASPAFGGLNPCGGNPTLNAYDPWHSPSKYYGAFACTVPAQVPVNPSPVTGVCQIVSRQDSTISDVGFEADYNFGFAQLTLLGNNNLRGGSLGKESANPFNAQVPPNAMWSNVIDQVLEARLNSQDGDALRWVTGIYWNRTVQNSNSWNRSAVTGQNAPLGSNNRQNQTTTDESAYAQATVPVTDSFRVVGGLRYANDDLAQNSFTQNMSTKAIIGPAAVSDFTNHKLTYKAGIELDLTPDSMFYANTATGFRPVQPAQNKFCVGNTSHHTYLPNDGSNVVNAYPTGGCATTAPVAAASVGGTAGEASTQVTRNVAIPPDSMTSYEVGVKNRFLDNRLQVNLDGYYYKFQSLFIQSLGVNDVNQSQNIFRHETGVKAWGSELEITALLTPNDRIFVGLSYEPTRSGTSPFSTPLCFNYGTAAHPLINVVTSTANLAACNAKNLAANPSTVNWVRFAAGVSKSDPLFSAPLWNGNIGYRHIFDLSSGATVSATVTEHFESSHQASAANYYDSLNPAYHRTDLAIAYDTADGKWSLGAWVKNVENNAVIMGGQSNATNAGTSPVNIILAPPRTWGVNLTAKF